ncbi:alpha/beta hydrolase family protein [Tropicimonas sp.]|uniref:alpha/beta hydrolase family protein n=1 Tax=Tropicimonas sp. TaxID=2067044 RepID=UPI003A8495DC
MQGRDTVAEDRRATLRRMLGGTPVPEAAADRSGTRNLGGWVLEDLRFRAADGEPVPAWFLHPPDGEPPVPAGLYCHAHGNRFDFGRDELIEGRPSLAGPYAPALRDLGCAALCIEMPGFGARRQPGESARTKAHLWQGTTLFGQMLAELSAGIGFLRAQPSVDGNRIGTLGLSMGCTQAWWLAALDGRIRAASALCCMADLGELIRTGAHDLHGIYMTVPGLTAALRTGQIAGLAAPRALQICAGMRDPLTPPGAFAIARADLEDAYERAGAAERLSFHVEPAGGHAETPAMRAAVLSFLRANLMA